MNCPACSNSMNEKEFGGVKIDVCTLCKGLWFDVHEIKQLDEKHEGFGGALKEALESDHHKVSERGQIKCAKCQTPMISHNYQSQKMVTVDECYGCGSFFLDSGELELIRVNFLSESDRDEQIKSIFEGSSSSEKEDVSDIIPGTEARKAAVTGIVTSLFKL
ncbi:MAG: Zn-finger nucleic acid-binding protein [Lysobacterales bacterium]|jgi:Zn-finger nucleic acid-binding protein